MANYQGLNCIMGEMTTMLSNSKSKEHTEHIYQFTAMMEKYVKIAVPQLIGDYLETFEETLIIEFETFLNGQQINQGDIAAAVGNVLQRAINSTKQKIKLVL